MTKGRLSVNCVQSNLYACPSVPLVSLTRKGWTQREFSEQLKLRGIRHGQVFIAQVVTDKAVMPINRIEAWAETLEIPAKDRKRFELLGAVTLCPINYQIEVQALFEKVAKKGKTKSPTTIKP